MINFLENLLGIIVYALIFSFFLWIYNPNLPIREYAGFGLIAGFFMGMLNEINRVLQNMKNN